MKLTKLILAALTIMMIGVLGAATTASAVENTQILPEPSEANPITFVGHSEGATKLVSGGNTVECAEAPTKGEFNLPRLGLVIIEFLKCKETKAGTECTGLEKGEPAGHIKVHAEVHIWPGRLINAAGETVLHLATAVFLLLHVHFACAFGTALVLVLGCVAALITTALEVLITVLREAFAENAKKTGINDITLVENEKGEFIPCELKTANNEGTETSTSLQLGTGVSEKFTRLGIEISVLVMG